MSDNAETPEQEINELRKRRERLEALKSKRSEVPVPPAAAAPAGLGAKAAGPGALLGGGGEGGRKRGRQRKMLMKVYKVLTQTPADASGHVPDTPFTETGVARLMDMLRTRSADPALPGAKVAEGLIKFISPSEGESATTGGASVEKLQMLARRIEHMRGKGGGGGRKGAW